MMDDSNADSPAGEGMNQHASTPLHPFEVLKNDPFFETIRSMIHSSPRETCENLIEQFRRTSPELYAAIRSDKEGFLRLFGYDIDYKLVNSEEFFVDQRYETAVFHFTQEEYNDIETLMKMGFLESDCATAYEIAGKNLQAAADILAGQSN